MTDELKPCAHCGHSVEFVYDKYAEINEDNPTPFGKIFCIGCGIQTGELMALDEAIAVWNSRVEPDTLQQWAIEAIEEKRDELQDIIDCKQIVKPLRDAAGIQIEFIDWFLSLRKPEETE